MWYGNIYSQMFYEVFVFIIEEKVFRVMLKGRVAVSHEANSWHGFFVGLLML